MSHIRPPRSRVLPLLALAVCLLAPVGAVAARSGVSSPRHTTASSAVYTFGIEGGNIRPFSLTINSDGSIGGDSYRPTRTHLDRPGDTLRALKKLQRAERFGSLPSETNCTHVLPDIARQFITTYGTSGRTVTVHGNCVGNFAQFYAVLAAVTGAQ